MGMKIEGYPTIVEARHYSFEVGDLVSHISFDLESTGSTCTTGIVMQGGEHNARILFPGAGSAEWINTEYLEVISEHR